MKDLGTCQALVANGTRVGVRNGKLFVISSVLLPAVDGTINTCFLDKKQFVAALMKYNGAAKFVNDKLVEEVDVRKGDSYVTVKAYNDYAVAYAASHCGFNLHAYLMEAGDNYDRGNGELGVIETNFVKYDIESVVLDDAMSAAFNKLADAERDFFGF